MQNILGFLAPTLIYGYIFLLNIVLPGRWVTGYATKEGTNEKLRYRLNGLVVLFTTLSTWVLLADNNIIEWDWLYVVRWSALAGAIVFGLVFSFVIVLKHPARKRSFIADFFLGRAANPQLWGGKVDAKMWLYLVGAVLLELNILNFAAHHYLTFGNEASPGIFLATALLTYFIIDYLTFEEVHLYTYDFFAENVGFKLGWGCIAFYPFFYSIPVWDVAELPNPQTPIYQLVFYAVLFFISWSLSRGANMQKYYFKKDPNKSFLGIKPETITDGKHTLLVNGFWGLSRHINYLGEIGMATAIVLAIGYPSNFWPWLYPLYYVALLFPRQRDDDKRCREKYGKLWDQYTAKVEYRIIPFIY
jgi:protein-S-isoprenylcysteine O-methyltransferase Ste14